MQDVLSEKLLSPRGVGGGEHLHDNYRVSERHACRLPGYMERRFATQPRIQDRAADAHSGDSANESRFGYRKIRVLLNREGWRVGKYRVECI